MKTNHRYPSTLFWGFCALLMAALFCPASQAQFWDMLTKPQITVNLTHPPRLGLNIKKVAFGPSKGECSDQILDKLSESLVSSGIEVMDRHRLHRFLAEQHLSLNGYMDQQSALRMGKVLGPTALTFVRISQCEVKEHRNYKEHKNRKGEIEKSFDAIAEIHIRGSLQTVDLATGRIFSASPIVQDAQLSNHSTVAPPEFPARRALRDGAIERAAYDASTMFVNWAEEKKLYFFNDKECNMGVAYTLLKANDFDGVVRQSEENIVACKTWPKLKDNSMAHAYYNAGLAYLLVNQHEKALFYLTESARLKGGNIVTETITQANNSARLDAEMRSVAERTEKFELEQEDRMEASQPFPDSASRPANSNASPDSPEERLKKLDSLYKKGLITGNEYETKRAAILNEI